MRPLPTTSPALRSGRGWLPMLGLLLLLALAYAGSWRGAFLWDDNLHITENPTIVGPLGLKEIWTSARAYYFPLVLTNFWIQHALWELDPLGYRLVTWGFHVISAVLLWRVLRGLRVPGAWLGAAFWALHPVQVESVAWICELKNTQSAAFFLASVLAYLRWIGPTNPAVPGVRASHSPRWRPYTFALVFAVLAILSKPSAVMLPLALGLCTWWRRGAIHWRDAFPLVPFFALSTIAAGWTIWEQKFHSGAIGEAWDQTLPERFAIAGRVVWFYLGKLLWPEPLIFIYPRWEIRGTDPLVYVGLVALAIVGVILWRGRHGPLRAWAFAAAYFVALLFPVLGFFSVYFFRYSFVGDHFQYLASMGPLALAGAGVARLSRRLPLVLGGAVVLALSLATARHALTFRNNETLWRHTVAQNPAAVMAWLNLGDVFAQAGRHDESIATFQHALTLKPNDPHGWNDLACELVLVGRPADALPAFHRALELQPDFPEAHNNLGNALRDLDRMDEAITHHRRAVELDPQYAEGHNNLGVALAQTGRSAEAVASFERSLALRPNDAATHDNLGNALRDLGRFDAALAEHETALRLNPLLAEAHANLGRTLMAAGRVEHALDSFRRALEFKPGLATLRSHYAAALAASGDPDAAQAELRRAVELAPTSAEAHVNLGTALAQSGELDAAIRHFQRAVELAPTFAEAHENLGTALAAGQRWAAASASFARAIELKPDALRPRTQLAVSLVNGGQLADAVPHFKAALQLSPESPELHDNLAQVFRALGRNREAFEHFEEAARLRLQHR